MLGAGAWFARLVSAALVREDWLGWTTLVLLLVAAIAALMLLLRELVGFSRLNRLNRIRADVAKAVAERDPKLERKAALRLAGLYARRPEQAWSVRRFREHARDVHDAGELLALADREMVAPLDREARRFITRSAKRVATVTAMSPMALIAVDYVAIENLRLLRALAALYGGRPGFFGLMRLAHLVFAHLLATGGVALTDDLLGPVPGPGHPAPPLPPPRRRRLQRRADRPHRHRGHRGDPPAALPGRQATPRAGCAGRGAEADVLQDVAQRLN